MKHFLVAASIVLFLFSCKKENNPPMDTNANKNVSFIQMVKAQLKDSLIAVDYASLDTNQFYKSTDAQSKGCFVRIAFLNKNIATDFVLLKTDSLGNIRMGKMVHIEKDSRKRSQAKFTGRFNITSLDKKSIVLKAVLNGKIKSVHSAMDLMEAEEPVGEQTLPDCVITCYTTDGADQGDWYWYGGFFDDYGGGGGNSYTYGYSGGGTGGNTNNSDNTIVVQTESNDKPPIKVEDYIKCFNNLPDKGATYQVTIYTDIPVNNDPSVMLNWSTMSPGHSFIGLTKTSGSTTVTQTFGFYPSISWQVLTSHPCDSKVVDNGEHRYDASLSQMLNSSQFATTISKLELLENTSYDMTTWNCTDFALSVYNASAYNGLTIPQYFTEGSGEAMNTPQGLYTAIKMLQASGNPLHGTPSVPKMEQQASESHGSCGNYK